MTDEPFPATITASRLITGMSRNARAKWLFVVAVAGRRRFDLRSLISTTSKCEHPGTGA